MIEIEGVLFEISKIAFSFSENLNLKLEKK